MDDTWKNNPTNLIAVPEDIQVLISIDESGTSDTKALMRDPRAFEDNPGRDNFTIAACAMDREAFYNASMRITELKEKYWENGCYSYREKDSEGNVSYSNKRVCFHMREIVKYRGPFKLEDSVYRALRKDLCAFVADAKFTCFGVNIRKTGFMKCCYTNIPHDPYCAAIYLLFERITHYLSTRGPAYIILESRGKKEDKALLNMIVNLIENGTNYCSSEKFRVIKGVFFNKKWQDDGLSYWQLELADIIAAPLHSYCVGKKPSLYDEEFRIIEKKLYSPNGRVSGWGFKRLPGSNIPV